MNKAAYDLALKNIRLGYETSVRKNLMKDIQVRHGNAIDGRPMIVAHVGKDVYTIRLGK